MGLKLRIKASRIAAQQCAIFTGKDTFSLLTASSRQMYPAPMAEIDVLMMALDNAHREFLFVFDGLSDDDLWRRAHPKLLSVGELAGHVVYWEATGVSSDESSDRIESPLVDKRFDYYTNEVDNLVVLELGVEAVASEMKRVHELVRQKILGAAPNLTDKNPSRPMFTWQGHLEYQAFHVAYHGGQAYSVCHLLGHTTTDN